MIAIPAKDIFIFEDKIRKMLDKSFEDVTNPKIYETEDWINRLKSGLVICFADRNIEFIVICSNANSTLYLNVIAGKNFSKHVDEAIEDITDFAKFAGCKMIQTTVQSKRNLLEWRSLEIELQAQTLRNFAAIRRKSNGGSKETTAVTKKMGQSKVAHKVR